jgi:hypothetical protein
MSERGEISLAGLIVAMALFAIVSWASVSLFLRQDAVGRTAQERTDAQDGARRAGERLARELRNLASPTQGSPQAIDRMGAQDLVFQIVSPTGAPTATNPANVMRVRWCVTGTTLRRMVQPASSFGAGVPASTACPGTGWSSVQVVAQHLANGSLPVFTYNAATPTEVTAIRSELWVDPRPGSGAPATQVATGTFLRNQNRRPVAVAQVVDGNGTGQLILNGTASNDPEGDTLTYQWLRNGAAIDGATTAVFRLTGLAANATHTIALRVTDPAGLSATSAGVVGRS